jgi:hypothetical protein
MSQKKFKQRGNFFKNILLRKMKKREGGKRLGSLTDYACHVTTTREKCRHLRPGMWDWVARLNYGGQKSECQGPRRWCYYSGATGLDVVHGRWGSKRKVRAIDWACVKCAKVWSKCTWRIAGYHHMLLAWFCPEIFFYVFSVSTIAL